MAGLVAVSYQEYKVPPVFIKRMNLSFSDRRITFAPPPDRSAINRNKPDAEADFTCSDAEWRQGTQWLEAAAIDTWTGRCNDPDAEEGIVWRVELMRIGCGAVEHSGEPPYPEGFPHLTALKEFAAKKAKAVAKPGKRK